MATLWEQLGGTRNMERIIGDFVDRAIADPEVNYTRDGRFALDAATVQLSKKSALEFFSAATGGPLAYSGRSLPDIHRDMRISNREFSAICGDFRASLQSHGVDLGLQEIVIAKVEATRTLIVDPLAPGGSAL
jgi:hemoglobin